MMEEQLKENNILFNELYEKTKDFGRVQFINLLMEKERENQELKEQLDYLRSGEYLNQLKFERNMLQDVVDKMEVSKEDKDFIDMTHRNTKLLEEKQNYKEVFAKLKKRIDYMFQNEPVNSTEYDFYIGKLNELLKEVE